MLRNLEECRKSDKEGGGLEGSPCAKRLKELGLFSLKKRNGKGRQESGLPIQEGMSQGRGTGEFQDKIGQPLVWDGKRFLPWAAGWT